MPKTWDQTLTGGNELMCIAEALRSIAESMENLTKVDLGIPKGGHE